MIRQINEQRIRIGNNNIAYLEPPDSTSVCRREDSS